MDAKSRKRAQQSARRRAKKIMVEKSQHQGASLYINDPDIDSGTNNNVSSCSDDNSNADQSSHNIAANVQSSDCSWKIFNEMEQNIQFDTFSDSDEEQDERFRRDLAAWAVECNIANTSLTKLLAVLRRSNLDVPAQATTLLQTQRNFEIIKKSGR
jgi:hypothetical protein